jgi:hypothetical protein
MTHKQNKFVPCKDVHNRMPATYRKIEALIVKIERDLVELAANADPNEKVVLTFTETLRGTAKPETVPKAYCIALSPQIIIACVNRINRQIGILDPMGFEFCGEDELRAIGLLAVTYRMQEAMSNGASLIELNIAAELITAMYDFRTTHTMYSTAACEMELARLFNVKSHYVGVLDKMAAAA